MTPAKPAPGKERILIVDDEPLNRFLIAEALATDNYDIAEAESGEAAIEYMTHHSADLILLDIDMPGAGGLAACRAIRALPHGGLVPIAMVTGLDDDSSVEHAFDCGATDFLTKPVNWTLMRQRVRFMLRLGSITRELHRGEQALQQVHEIAEVGHWQWDIASRVVYHSEAYRRLFPGIPPRLTDVTLDVVAESEYGRLVLAQIKRAIHRGEQGFRFECTVDVPERGKRRLAYHGSIEYSVAVEIGKPQPLHLICTVQDITQRHADEERYAAIFDASPVGIVESEGAQILAIAQQSGFFEWSDAQLRAATDTMLAKMSIGTSYSKVNPAAQRMLLQGTRNSQLAKLRAEITLNVLTAIRNGKRQLTVQHRLAQRDGPDRYIIVSAQLPTTPEDYRHIVISFSDVSELVHREEQLKRADTIIANSSDAIVIMDKDRRILAINPAFTKILGYTLEQAQAVSQFSHWPEMSEEQLRAALNALLEKQDDWQGEIELRRRDGSLMPALLRINVLRNGEGEIDGLFSIISDISHIKESERRLYQLAHYDELTGLPNRLSLQERLQHELEGRIHGAAGQREFALLYIDLDGFKLVNDSMGHPTGDKLLRGVSARLNDCCQPGDLLTRIGGDEFALLMFAGIATADIEAQADRILTALETPFVIEGREIFIGASIGACRYPVDATSADEMLRNADSAMYEAKRLGRGQLCYYSAELTDESNRRLQVENELRVAIASDQLFLLYQPQYDAVSGAIIGAEALVRWRNPRRGVIPPGEFIGIAETSGLIIPLGEWVINEVCRQIAGWQRTANCTVPVAINIAAAHLRQHDLPRVLDKAFKHFDIDPGLLEIEITEDSLDFRGEEYAPYDILNKISALGVAIAIDDFGTGYSSLSRLKEMPISTLKIDRSFVRDIASSESDHAIITAIVGLAKTLEMSIVAEGVETEAQATQLRALKCNILQGFLYSKPLPPDEFLKIFLAQRTRP